MSFYTRLQDWYRDFSASPADLYLSQALNHHDLECRMQAINRGEAPFQRLDRTFGTTHGFPHF